MNDFLYFIHTNLTEIGVKFYLCGSLALKELGIIERKDIKDIDIVVENPEDIIKIITTAPEIFFQNKRGSHSNLHSFSINNRILDIFCNDKEKLFLEKEFISNGISFKIAIADPITTIQAKEIYLNNIMARVESENNAGGFINFSNLTSGELERFKKHFNDIADYRSWKINEETKDLF